MARINDNKRANSPERLKYQKKHIAQYRKNNPKKHKAHCIVNNYFRYHKEEKPVICSYCG